MKKVIAYTDGSATTHGDKLGGWGCYLTYEEDGQIIEEKFFHKGYKNTKTGRMELMAVINCLKNIQDKSLRVQIYSDSIYVVNCIRDRRLWRWRRNMWVGLKNIELLMNFLSEVEKFHYIPELIHIKGHTLNNDKHSLGNEIADKLASYKQFEKYEIDLI